MPDKYVIADTGSSFEILEYDDVEGTYSALVYGFRKEPIYKVFMLLTKENTNEDV